MEDVSALPSDVALVTDVGDVGHVRKDRDSLLTTGELEDNSERNLGGLPPNGLGGAFSNYITEPI